MTSQIYTSCNQETSTQVLSSSADHHGQPQPGPQAREIRATRSDVAGDGAVVEAVVHEVTNEEWEEEPDATSQAVDNAPPTTTPARGDQVTNLIPVSTDTNPPNVPLQSSGNQDGVESGRLPHVLFNNVNVSLGALPGLDEGLNVGDADVEWFEVFDLEGAAPFFFYMP